MVTLEIAREWLRLDGTDNDFIIEGLLAAVPGYIEVTTGLKPLDQEKEPLADTVTRFLLILWYDAEQADADQLQKTIDNLLKALSLKKKHLPNR
ncbi:MAG: head-tail connector protein [Peptococcaceae bacterium]|nr:head-tail connector protein [Peptococcaceae bacterium]